MTQPASILTTTPVSESRRMPRVESLTGLRWFAAFAVFLFHTGQLLPLPKVYHTFGSGDLFAFGDSGVTFFYILSGFVLTWSFSAEVGIATFYWRRFARVWPMLVVTTAFAWLCFAQSGLASARQTLLSLSLVEAWFRPASTFLANPVAWSISCEAFFYLLFPFVVRPILRLRLPALLAAGAALLVVEWAYWITVRGFINPADFWVQLSWYLRFPPYRFVEFLLGVVAAAALRQGWRPRVNLWFALCLAPVSVLVLLEGARRGWWQPLWSEQGLTPAFLCIVVAAALRDLDGRPSFLRSRPMVALGGWSYSFYLVHLSVLYWVTRHLLPGSAGWANLRPILVAAVAATLLAWAAYRWIEHPTERALRRLYPRRAAPSRPISGADQQVDVPVVVAGPTGNDLPR